MRHRCRSCRHLAGRLDIDLEGSRQRAHHPIPADYQQGDEGSRDGVDDHSLTIFRIGFLAISRRCDDCHAAPPKVDSIKIRLHYFCINKISNRYFGSSGNSVQKGSSLTRSAPLVADHPVVHGLEQIEAVPSQPQGRLGGRCVTRAPVCGRPCAHHQGHRDARAIDFERYR
jgi:hypothetical protein